MNENISTYVRALLENKLDKNNTLPQIAKATGIEYHTLRHFYLNAGADMASHRIQRLYEHLTGEKLIGGQA